MKTYIFGMDAAQPEKCARLLRDHGFDSVVLGSANERICSALDSEGLELYLCFGAHSVPAGCDSSLLAQDFDGMPRKWFSSGCPNEKSIWAAHLHDVLETTAKYASVRGVFVDGARFASFASQEGTESFFTCFCPRCMEKMQASGYDPAALRQAVQSLAETRRWDPSPLLDDWLRFRERCVAETMNDFAAQIHALRTGLLAGGFVFAPSLGRYVGQTPEACRGLDIVAPMIYRAYPHAEGPACLNHEWSAFRSMFPHEPYPSYSPETILKQGFPIDHIRTEVAATRAGLIPGQRLSPILQIEDARPGNAADAARAGGADAVGFFMWGQSELPDFRRT